MQSIPPALLDQLIGEISTLASVYHKPPETFIGQGRFGADAVAKRAIEEQQQNARETTIQAPGVKGANAENLLDIDFDGAAPASASPPTALDTMSGGTPTRVASPPSQSTSGNNLDDLLGVFDSGPAPSSNGLVGELEGLNFGGSPPPQPQQKRTNEDILALF